MTATRDDFLAAYKMQLAERYDWARNRPNQLIVFMHSVTETIKQPRSVSWICDGAAVQAAWEKIGRTGKVSLAKLRKLPVRAVSEGEAHAVHSA